ncbi:hypothetical protein EJ05DRAFT_481333 [Pseudovirgaria hyperparasitica]|uniref:Uncharacterized protein n=1 Tax=Pseudovirgaria hyperparasitica TaxID=470096 RepID=A0A6A6VP18_9PEZI|nr:uncharacterized protein EJ05DRAFT_481333 [Pseudovirgaria hyperparasitica]KAF2752372.1 hypothetical protein EJ05DRAFT_481333 [Pseudovirgaria hyperparasitica]
MPPQYFSQANVPLPGIEPNASKDDGILINPPFKRLFLNCWALIPCVNWRKERAADDVKDRGHEQTTSQPWRCDSWEYIFKIENSIPTSSASNPKARVKVNVEWVDTLYDVKPIPNRKGSSYFFSLPYLCCGTQYYDGSLLGDHFTHHHSSEDRVEKCTPALWFENTRKQQAIDAPPRLSNPPKNDAEAKDCMIGSQMRA